MEIRFDQKKVSIVKIGKVRANAWNPKEDNTPEFEKIKRGIKLKGLRMPIVVREDEKGYEIIDGEQRFTACRDLGYKQVLIYNEGKVSDKEAKELTLWYQQQVPFKEVDLAKLLKDLSTDIDPKLLEVPYSQDEIDSYLKLTEFDWDAYKNDTPVEKAEEKRVIDLRLKFSEEQGAIFDKALIKAKDEEGNVGTNEEAVTKICEYYLKKEGKKG